MIIYSPSGSILEVLKCVYIHTPYCVHKCGYCDFNSYARRKSERDFHLESVRYVQCLLKEWDLWRDFLREHAQSRHFHWHHERTIPSVFVGGGTPSLLPVYALEILFNKISEESSAWREVTMEANPESMDEERRAWMMSSPISRLSFGIQSFNVDVLHKLERIHSEDQTLSLLAWLSRQEKLRWSGDFIYGVPGQSQEDFFHGLELYSTFKGADHISCYQLTLRSGHPLYSQTLDQDDEADWWERLLIKMESLGYSQYEVSNFSRHDNFRCVHNLNYWRGHYFLGLGAGASSYIPQGPFGSLAKNQMDPSRYMETIESGRLAAIFESPLTESQAFEQYLMMRFRTKEPFSFVEISVQFPNINHEWLHRCVETWARRGLVLLEGNQFRLTKRGLGLGDNLIIQGIGGYDKELLYGFKKAPFSEANLSILDR